MVGVGLMVMAALLSAASLVSASSGGVRGVLTLERLFPLGKRVELDDIKARDSVRHARMLQSFSGGIVDFLVDGTSDPYIVGNFSLFYSSCLYGHFNSCFEYILGLYYTKVRLGSPPREFNVQIDTGSDILWVTCSSCNNCPRSSGLAIPLNFFDAATSSTVSSISCSEDICASIVQTASVECSTGSNQCGYSFQYKDGSGTAGFYVSDLLYFDTILGTSVIANSSATVVFGCSTSLFGDLTKSDRAVDGIIGFGRTGLSVISQLSSRGITPNVFSHCLRGDDSGGGILVLGEILDPRIVYTPLVPSQSHYNLYLQSIAVNGQLLPIDQAVFSRSENQGTIVDSGTTLAYLVEGAYDPFVAAVTASVSQSVKPIISEENQCYLVYASVTAVFPLVTFNFAAGAAMILRPIDYLVNMGYDDGAAMWCMGFVKVRGQGPTILGDLVLKDKIVVYDLAHQRIGWTNYDCSLSVNVSITSGRNEFLNAGQLNVSGSSSSRVLLNVIHESSNAFMLYILLLVCCLFF